MKASPYYSKEFHGKAVLYPFTNALKCLLGAGRIINGCLLLGHALFNEPGTAIPAVAGGIGHEILALIVNALNIAASLISLLTRSLATLFAFGYIRPNVDSAFNGREMSGRNAETTMNMIGGILAGPMMQAIEQTEQVTASANLAF